MVKNFIKIYQSGTIIKSNPKLKQQQRQQISIILSHLQLYKQRACERLSGGGKPYV